MLLTSPLPRNKFELFPRPGIILWPVSSKIRISLCHDFTYVCYRPETLPSGTAILLVDPILRDVISWTGSMLFTTHIGTCQARPIPK